MTLPDDEQGAYTGIGREPGPLDFLQGTPVESAWDYIFREMPALARRAVGSIPGEATPVPGSEFPAPDIGAAARSLSMGLPLIGPTIHGLTTPQSQRDRARELEGQGLDRNQARRAAGIEETLRGLSGVEAVTAGLLLGVPATIAAVEQQGREIGMDPHERRDLARRGRGRLPEGTLPGMLADFAVPETGAFTGAAGAARAVGRLGRYRYPTEVLRGEREIAEAAARGDIATAARTGALPRGVQGPVEEVAAGLRGSVLRPTSGTSAVARTAAASYDAPPSLREYRPSPDQVDDETRLTRAQAEDIIERGPTHGPMPWGLGRIDVQDAREAIARMDQQAMVTAEPPRGQRALFRERDIVPGRPGRLELRRAGQATDYDPETGIYRDQAEEALRPMVMPDWIRDEPGQRQWVRGQFENRRRARQALRNLGDDQPFRVETNDDEVARAVTETHARERAWAGEPQPLRSGAEVGRPSDTTFDMYAGADGPSVYHDVFSRGEQNQYREWWREGRLTTTIPVPIHSTPEWEFSVGVEMSGWGGEDRVLLLARPAKGGETARQVAAAGGSIEPWAIAGTYVDGGPHDTYLGLMDEFKGKGAGPRFLVAAQRLLGKATQGVSYTEQGFENRIRAHRLDVEARAREMVTGIDEFETARRRAYGELDPPATAPAGPPPHPAVVAEYPDLFPEGYGVQRLTFYAKAEAASGGVMSWRRVLVPESIPYMTDWSAGRGVPVGFLERMKRAGIRFAREDRGSLDITFGGRFFPDKRTRLAIAPGGRMAVTDRVANVRFANPPAGAVSHATTPEELLARAESLAPADARWGSESSAVITTDGKWYRSDDMHHSQWLHSLGLGGSEYTTDIDYEQARFGFIRLYHLGDAFNFSIVGRPSDAQGRALREMIEMFNEANERLGGDRLRFYFEVLEVDRTTGFTRPAVDPNSGAYLTGNDPEKMMRAFRFAHPSELLRQAVLRPGATADDIITTTPDFENWARQAGVEFERDPSVGIGFTRDWGDERDIDLVVKGAPDRAEWYGANLADEWNQDAFFAIHFGEGDQVVGTLPIKGLRPQGAYVAEDAARIAAEFKAAGLDGHIAVREEGEVFVIAPQGLDASEFQMRMEDAARQLTTGAGADIAGLRIERAKVVAYARDEATAEKFGIPRENTYAAAIERGGGRARRGAGDDPTAYRSRAGGTGTAASSGSAGTAGGPEAHAAGVPHVRERYASLEEQRLQAALQDGPTPDGPPPGVSYNEIARRAGYDREAMHLTNTIGPLTPTEQAWLARRWGGRGLSGAFPGVPRAPQARRNALVRHVEALERRLGRDLEGEELAGLAHLYGVSVPRRLTLRRLAREEHGFATMPGGVTPPPLTAWDDLTPDEQVGAHRAAAIRLVELAQQGRPVRTTTRGEVYEGNQPRQFSTQTQRLVPGPAGTEGFDPTFQALTEQGERLAPEIEARTAPVTWAATEAAAAMLGRPARDVARGLLKRGVTTAEVEMVSTEVARLMGLVSDVSARIKIDPTSVSMKERLQAVMWAREADELRVSLEQSASELGRGLNILRKRVNEQLALAPDEREFRSLIAKVIGTADPDKVDRLLMQLLAVRDDPRAVYQLFRDLRKSSFWDKAFEYSQANILWASATHITNTVSGLIQTALLTSKYVVVGPTAEKAMQALTLGRYQPEVAFGDGLPYLQGLMKGYLAAAKKVPNLIRDEGDLTGVRYAEFLRPGPAIPGRLGRVIRTPFTMLTIEDAFQTIPMYTAVREVEIAKLARRAHPGDTAAQRQMIESLRNEITPERISAGGVSTDGLTIHRTAHKIAEEFALHGRGPALDALNDLRRKAPGLRYVIRFINTPYNLAKMGLRHSPVGLGRLVTDRLTGAPPTRVSDAVREAAVGGFFMWWAFSLMESDNATGLWPTNKTERDMWQAEGRGPLMVRVGDRWVSALVLGPLLMPYMFAAAIRQVHTADGSEPDDAQVQEALGWMGRNFADQVPMLTGLRQVSDLLDSPLSDRSANIVANMATSFIPAVSLLREAERIMDTYQRAPKGIGEAIQAAIPILAAEGLPQANLPPIRPQRDVFGRPVEGATGGWAALPRSMQDKPDPIITEWRRHMEADPDFAGITRVSDSIGSGSKKVDLSSQEYDRYQVLVGTARHEAITKVMQSRAYREAQGPQQREMLSSAKSNAEAAGRLAFGVEKALKASKPEDAAVGVRIAVEAGRTATDAAIALDAIRRAGRLTPEVVSLVDQQGHDLTVAEYDRGLTLRREYDRLPPFRDPVMAAIRQAGVEAPEIEQAADLLRKMVKAVEDKGGDPDKDSSIQSVYRAAAGGWLRRLYTSRGTLREAEQHPGRDKIEKDPLWDKFRSGARVGR